MFLKWNGYFSTTNTFTIVYSVIYSMNNCIIYIMNLIYCLKFIFILTNMFKIK